MTNKQLFVYTRKSKDEDGHSIDMQLSAAEKLKNDLGFDEIIHLNEGQGISGATRLSEREKSRELIAFIENGQCKHLFLYEWTRIARDEIEAMLFRKILIDNNVLVYTSQSNAPIDLNKEENKLLASIMGAVSEFERSKLITRIKDSLKVARKKGHFGGVLPFGYKRNGDKKYQIDDAEHDVYKQMVAMVLQGLSVRAITNWLNDNDIPNKTQSEGALKFRKFKNSITGEIEHRDVRESVWKDNVVLGILKNPLYKGYRYDKYGQKNSWHAIISEQEWDLLQVKLEENISRHRNGNKQVHNFLLKNLIYCGKHNIKFLGKIKPKEQTYYCNKKRKEIRMKNEPPCHIRSLNLPKFETFVWNTLIDVLKQSNSYREIYKSKKLNDKSKDKITAKISSEINKLNKSLNDKSNAKRKIQLSYFERDEINEEDFKQLSAKFANEIKEIEFQITKRKNELEFLESDSRQDWVDWYKDFHIEVESWRNVDDFEFKRSKIEKHIDIIWVKDFDPILNIHKIEIVFKRYYIDELKYKTSKHSDGYDINSLNNKLIYDFKKKVNFKNPHINLPQHLRSYGEGCETDAP